MMYRLFGTVALLCLLLSGCGGDTGDIAESGRLSNAAPAEKGEPGQSLDFCADETTIFTVLDFSPDRDAQEISVKRKQFSVTFNANVDETSIKEKLRLIALPRESKTQIGQQIVSVDGPVATITVTSSENLLFDTVYRIEITDGVLADCPRGETKAATAKDSNFTTAGDTRPRVGTTSPVDGAQSVPLGSVIKINFDQNVSYTENAFQVEELVEGEEPTPVQFPKNPANNVDSATLSGFEPALKESSFYRVTILSNEVTNSESETLQGNGADADNFQFSFVMETNFAPFITNITPADGDESADLSSGITIDFSEVVTIDSPAEAIKIFDSEGNLVPCATETTAVTTDSYNCIPDGLEPGETYTVVIDPTKIADDKGTQLRSTDDDANPDEALTFTFTTGDSGENGASNGPIKLVSATPDSTVTGTTTRPIFEIVFDGKLPNELLDSAMKVSSGAPEENGFKIFETNANGERIEGSSDAILDLPGNNPPRIPELVVTNSLNEKGHSVVTVTVTEGQRFPNSAYYEYDFVLTDAVTGPAFESNTAILAQKFRVQSTIVALDTDVLRLFEQLGPLSPLETEVNALFNSLYRNPLTGELLDDALNGSDGATDEDGNGSILTAVVLDIPLTTPLTTDPVDLPLDGQPTSLLDRDSVVAVCNPYQTDRPCVLKLNLNLDSSGVLTGNSGDLVVDLVEDGDQLEVSLVAVEDGSTTDLLSTATDDSVLTDVVQAVQGLIVNPLGDILTPTDQPLLNVDALRGAAVEVDLFGREVASLFEIGNSGTPELIRLFDPEDFMDILMPENPEQNPDQETP